MNISGNPVDPVSTEKPLHTSVMLRELIDKAPPGHFTLGWLINSLPKHSYGFILLFLALVALLPIISIPARLLIILLTGQIVLGYHRPVLPKRLMKRQLPSKYLVRLKRHAVPALRKLENIVRPRWPVLFMARGFRRFVAFIALLNTALSLPAPIPLANMPPAAIGVLLALAYIEHDGVTLLIALLTACAILGVISFALIQSFM
jgi:hypothetical protein